jgi:hypothetical protein
MRVDQMKVREVIILNDEGAKMRMTGDGYMVSTPRVARTGIQVYSGSELGRSDMARVRVYRPESEVMSKDAMGSIAHRPITNDHPGEAVTADNWKKYSVGQTGDEVARDGDFIRVPMVLMDAETIKAVKDGKRELSLGYNAALEWTSGTTQDGQEYDAIQRDIRVNHLAVVDAARGGAKLAIGDSDRQANQDTADKIKRLIDSGSVEADDHMPVEYRDASSGLSFRSSTPGISYCVAKDGIVYRSALVSTKAQAEKDADTSLAEVLDGLLQLVDTNDGANAMTTVNMQKLLVDAISVDVSDTAAQVINRAIQQRDAEIARLTGKVTTDAATSKSALDAANTQIATLTTSLSTKDAEIVTLKQQVTDSAITPAKLDLLVKDRGNVVGKARIVMGSNADKLVIDGKTDGEIRRQVVDSKLGDAAKGWDDVMVRASFDTMTADIKPEQLVSNTADSMRAAFNGNPGNQRPQGWNGQQAQPQGGGQQAPQFARDGENVYDAYDRNISEAWKGGGVPRQ